MSQTLAAQHQLWTPWTLSLPTLQPRQCKSCGSLHHPHSSSLGQVSISPKPANFPWGIFTSWPSQLRGAGQMLAPRPRKYPIFQIISWSQGMQNQDLFQYLVSSTSSWSSLETQYQNPCSKPSVPAPASLQRLAPEEWG